MAAQKMGTRVLEYIFRGGLVVQILSDGGMANIHNIQI